MIAPLAARALLFTSYLLLTSCPLASGFLLSPPRTFHTPSSPPRSPPRRRQAPRLLLQPSSSRRFNEPLFAAPPDIDTVVVSAAFWSSLRSKVVSALIGNLLAGAVVAAGGAALAGGLAKFGFDKMGESGADAADDATKPVAPNEPDVVTPTKMTTGPGAESASPLDSILLNRESLTTLAVCVLIDVLGDASFALPFLGDFSDLVFAPLSGLLLYQIFGSGTVAAIGVVEEALPGTDFLPTACVAWWFKFGGGRGSKVGEVLGVGKGGREE